MSPASLYLDQNYLSGIAKHKPAFTELGHTLDEAVRTRAIAILESEVHERESAPRPDLHLMELLRALSYGQRLPDKLDRAARDARRRMSWIVEHELPERRDRPSDVADLDALARAVIHCDLIATDAFMADVIRRARLDLRHRCELFSGRRGDVRRLNDRLLALMSGAERMGGRDENADAGQHAYYPPRRAPTN